jgi:hypothetical protein
MELLTIFKFGTQIRLRMVIASQHQGVRAHALPYDMVLSICSGPVKYIRLSILFRT